METEYGHSILMDYSIFLAAQMPDLDQPGKVYNTDEVDLRLKSNSVAIDAGLVLANINDTYTGSAPDLGAYETGQELPHYGPR